MIERKILLVLGVLAITGCANQTAEWYVPPSVFHITSMGKPVANTTTTVCVDADGGNASCLYYSENISGLTNASMTATARIDLLHRLLALSDRNCQTFLNRSMAARNNVGGIRDLTTGLAAIFAHGEPSASVAFSVANLGIGSVRNQFENNVYRGHDFAIVHAQILQRREKMRADHIKAGKNYSLGEIMSAVAAYDAECSTAIAAARVTSAGTKAATP